MLKLIIMGSNVNNLESLLLQAQARLDSAKDLKKQAQANGNYANAKKETKTFVDGKSLNSYDYNIYMAQKAVKEYKAKLAEAKRATKKK
jgi:hypothetical protein